MKKIKEIIKDKKNIKSLLLIISGIMVITGIAYSSFFVNLESLTVAKIKTPTISLTYTEQSSAYELDDSGLTIDEGKNQKEYFEFTVSSTSDVTYDINYNIYLTTGASNTLKNNKVYVYLTEVNDGVETEVLAPTKVNLLTGLANYSNSYLLESDSFNFTSNTTTTKSKVYRLRAWTDYTNPSTSTSDSTTNYTIGGIFDYTVNVDTNSLKETLASTIRSDNTIKTLSSSYMVETIGNDTTKSGFYSFIEEDNVDYFFRGYVNNNWVKFGKTSACQYNGEEVLYVSDITNQVVDRATSSTCEFQGICSYNGYLLTYDDNATLQAACTQMSGTYIDATPTWNNNADIYWRIYRITDSDEVRMIYAGTTEPTEETQYIKAYYVNYITYDAFNDNYDNAEYVGYKYTLGNAHGTGTDSTIKTVIDTWYTSTLASGYGKYISTSNYCYDRTTYQGSVRGATYSGSGVGSGSDNYTWFMAVKRLKGSGFSDMGASLICENSDDIYSTNIGLISVDEANIAGLRFYAETNNEPYNYLVSGHNNYWTGSPYAYYAYNTAAVFYIGYKGGLSAEDVNTNYVIRPVITLKSNVMAVSGTDGTWDNPYEITIE